MTLFLVFCGSGGNSGGRIVLLKQRQLKWYRLFLCMNGDDGDTMNGGSGYWIRTYFKNKQ